MKKVKDFNDFTYNPLLKNLENNQLTEQLSIGKYQRSLQKFYKDSGYFLYYASTFNTATLVLIPVIEKLFPYFSMEEALMLTVFSIAVLTNESKSKVENLYKYLLEHDIVDEEIQKTVSVLTNIYEIFKAILKVGGEELDKFADMLSSTAILVPFLNVFGSLITNGFIDSELFTKSLQDIKDELGEKGFKLLLHRILHKLNIITKSTDKFQNKDNVKPLKVNDEFKSPLLQSEDTILEESIRDQMIGKLEKELDDAIPKEIKEFIDKCYQYMLNEDERFTVDSEPHYFSDYGTHGHGFTFNESFILAYFDAWGEITIKNLESGMQSEIGLNFKKFKRLAKYYLLDSWAIGEKLSLDEMTTDVKSKVEKSRKLSKDMKEKIIPLITQKGIHGTTYNKGRVAYLKIPKVPGKSFKGVSLGADKNGFYVMTHRARSKSYTEINDIPNKDIKFVESTG